MFAFPARALYQAASLPAVTSRQDAPQGRDVFITPSWSSSSSFGTKPLPPHVRHCCSSSVPFSMTPSPSQSGQVFMCASCGHDRESVKPSNAPRASIASVLPYLSFPKIISARIGDAIRTRLVLRRWSRIVGRRVVAARPCPTPGACASRCNRANTRSGPVASAVRRRSRHGPSSRAAASRSGAQHRGSAKANSVISGGPESPLPGLDA